MNIAERSMIDGVAEIILRGSITLIRRSREDHRRRARHARRSTNSASADGVHRRLLRGGGLGPMGALLAGMRVLFHSTGSPPSLAAFGRVGQCVDSAMHVIEFEKHDHQLTPGVAK